MKISVAALSFLLLVASISLTSAGPSSLVSSSCCNGRKIKPIKKNILKSFSRNRGCIEFTTKRGIKICADPEVAWVKDLLKLVPEVEKDRS